MIRADGEKTQLFEAAQWRKLLSSLEPSLVALLMNGGSSKREALKTGAIAVALGGTMAINMCVLRVFLSLQTLYLCRGVCEVT